MYWKTGFRFPVLVWFLSSPSLCPDPHPAIRRVQEVLSSRIKRLEREADHSSPSDIEVKNDWRFTSILPKGFFPSGFGNKFLYLFLNFLVRATCPAHLILLDLVALIFSEECKLWTSSLCNFLQSSVASSLFAGSNISLCCIFLNTSLFWFIISTPADCCYYYYYFKV
jgi:hypothetical protein